jgi:hypothetical protein
MYRRTAALAVTVLLALGAAARGDDDESAGSSTASSRRPVAQIRALTDALDGGLVIGVA